MRYRSETGGSSGLFENDVFASATPSQVRVVYPRCRRRYRRFVQVESRSIDVDPPEDIKNKY